MVELLEEQLSGRFLYGDDLSLADIARWYDAEKTGFFDLLKGHYGIASDDGAYDYEYEALNRFHAIDRLAGRRFSCCVALGCAAGDDVAPLAPMVDRFVGIEPAEVWWRSEIGGKPARYLSPALTGEIDLQTGAADLATAFGVLHHIPNVSRVVGEIARVLRPGGLFLVREPISWMGDWRKPRPGLTANERGLPPPWFEKTAAAARLRVIQRRMCMFNPLTAAAKRLGFPRPFAVKPLVALDWLVCEALRWNVRYRRETVFQKLAPSAAFWILERIE